MKVLLISVNNETDPYPVAPIGVAYIAKALKDAGHDVRILDICFANDYYRDIRFILKSFLPEVIGISIRNIDNLTCKKSVFYLPGIKDVIDFIRNNISAPLVVGGSGFSIFPEEVLRYLHLDFGIVGEGESALSEFVHTIEHGGDIYKIPNLCSIKDGIFKQNTIHFNRHYTMPDRTLLDNNKYLELGGMANIQSKRGCPFKCIYCTYPNIDGDRLRVQEPAAVIEELREMKDNYGIDYVFFVDDIFNYPEEHAFALCEGLIKANLKIDWACFATPGGMKPELAKIMKMAGCKGIEFGTDGGSERMLKQLGKSFTIDDVVSATETCKSVNLPNAHYILFGGPGENSATLNEAFTLFDKIRPTAVIALIGIRIYPNTLLYYKAIEDRLIEKDTNLLEPVFYLTPEMKRESIFSKVCEYATRRHNWVVPNLNIQCDSNKLATIRKMGKRGPLWDMLS